MKKPTSKPVADPALMQKAFTRLCQLPPEHPFWRNDWRLTRPVLTNNSRQLTDEAEFLRYAATLPADLQHYILAAPTLPQAI